MQYCQVSRSHSTWWCVFLYVSRLFVVRWLLLLLLPIHAHHHPTKERSLTDELQVSRREPRYGPSTCSALQMHNGMLGGWGTASNYSNCGHNRHNELHLLGPIVEGCCKIMVQTEATWQTLVWHDLTCMSFCWGLLHIFATWSTCFLFHCGSCAWHCMLTERSWGYLWSSIAGDLPRKEIQLLDPWAVKIPVGSLMFRLSVLLYCACFGL